MNSLAPKGQRPGSRPSRELVPGSPEFLRAVRQAAGWRVSPRHVDPVIVALHQAGKVITVEHVASIVNELRGERSQRQRRNADLWQMLGTHLALQGQPAHPAAQRELLGRIKRLVGTHLPDSVFLTAAVHVAAAGYPLQAHLVARVIRWLLERYSAETLETERLEHWLPQAIDAVLRHSPALHRRQQSTTRHNASTRQRHGQRT